MSASKEKANFDLNDLFKLCILSALAVIIILMMRPTDKDTLNKCMANEGYAVTEGGEQYLNAGYQACKITHMPNALDIKKMDIQIAGAGDSGNGRTWEGGK